MAGSSPNYSIAVVVRALDVLDALAESEAPLGTTELARRLGTTKSAVYRILATLEERDYVTKDPLTARYRLGTHLAYLGERSLGGFDVRQAARALLDSLHQRFHETVNLGVLEDTVVVYIDMVESDHGLRMAARLGARDPAHSTSLGKAILAFLPEPRLERYLNRKLEARTGRTITDPDELRRELARIRETGVAEDRGENEEGARCWGAPILDHTGAPVAAISISVPETRINDERAAEIAEAVRSAALEVTRRIGGRVPAMAMAAGKG